MRKTLAVLVILVGSCSAIPTRAGDAATVKCGANQDRVWVYDSLTTFDVQSKIRCGENIEIIGRAKGYVKIRMHDGSEGYVADTAIPGLPPLEDPDAKPADNGAPSSTDSLGTIARRIAPHPAAASTNPAGTSNAISSPMAPSQPAVAMNAAPVTTSASGVSAVPSTIPHPAAPAVAAVVPVSSPAASPIIPVAASNTNVQVAQTIAKPVTPVVIASDAHPAPKPKPVSPVATRATPSGARSQTPAANAVPNAPVLSPSPAIVKPLPAVNTEITVNIPAPPQVREVPVMRNVSANADSEEFPDFQPPVSDSADPACQSYFSAYGLAPSQIKWLAENRKKEFPSICPAPDPSKVDFVVLFSHDVNAYSSALPTPVHTDRNGFSDFSATVGVDTATLTTSEADKAHRQFVWVFLMKRGAFNPSTFSPRRRYQYAQVESNSTGSKAGVKTVEDAFEFAEQQSAGR